MRKFIIQFFGLGVLLIAISACKTTTEPQPSIGYLSIYNFSPSYNTYDIYVGDRKKNSANIPFAGGVKYDQYLVGKYSVKLNEAGTSNNLFTNTDVNLKNGEFNSLYVFGSAGSLESIQLKDVFELGNANKAYVRFINLSSNAPNLDFALKDSTTIASNKAYKTYTEYFPFDTKATVFVAKDNANGTVLAQTESAVLRERYYYTVVVGGKLNPGNLERNISAYLLVNQ